jgi:hypothetical protein
MNDSIKINCFIGQLFGVPWSVQQAIAAICSALKGPPALLAGGMILLTTLLFTSPVAALF